MIYTNLSQIIRQDCYIVAPNGRVVTAEVLRALKNYYKKEIYQAFNGKTVGKVGLVWSNNLDVIYPSMLAIWELGMAISVHDFNLETVRHPSFSNFYKHIDLVIGASPSAPLALPNIPHIECLETVMNYPSYSNDLEDDHISCLVSLDSHPDQSYTLDQPIDENTIAVVTHTSGTTGDPKVITTSHCDSIELVKKNIEIFDFLDSDKFMHHKTLHHGALFLNYAVPAFVISKHHHWVMPKSYETRSTDVIINFLNRCLKKCQDDRITKWLVAYDWVKLLKQCADIDLPNTSLITVIGPTQSDLKEIFKRVRFHRLYNNFGCQELGTLFVSCTSADTVDNYQPNFFNRYNDLVDIKIEPRNFLVKFKSQQEYRIVGDILTKDQNGIHWLGRNTVLEKDHNEIDIAQVSKCIRQYLGDINFSLVPDYELGQMYLALVNNTKKISLSELNQELINNFGNHCTISKLENFKFDSVMQGIKPSQPVLIYFFRQLQN
jgi:hypothetical protein